MSTFLHGHRLNVAIFHIPNGIFIMSKEIYQASYEMDALDNVIALTLPLLVIIFISLKPAMQSSSV